MTDPWIPFMVWCAAIAGLWIVCVILQHVYDNRREARALAKEKAVYGTAETRREQSLRSMARMVRDDRRPLDQRVAADLAARGHASFTAADVHRFVDHCRPHQSGLGDRALSRGGLSDESGLGYDLHRVGGDGDRAA